MDDLKDKLSRVKDEHAAEIVEQSAAEHDERSRMQAAFILGRIRQVGHDARAIATALSAQEIRALEQFQQEKMFESLGYTTFVDFLEKSEYSPMSRRQYYDRLNLIREHGDEIYDLLTSVGISVRAQKLLGKGDLAIKGDRLVVGDQEVDVANTGVIKQVLEELFDDRRELKATVEKLEEKTEKLDAQLAQGESEYQELQRNFDKLRSGDPYDEAVAHAINALLLLTEQIGHLDDDEKAKRGPDAMETLWAVMLQVRKSYGVNFAFTENVGPQAPSLQAAAAAGSAIDIKAAIGDDDFGDEEEV